MEINQSQKPKIREINKLTDIDINLESKNQTEYTQKQSTG